MLEQLTEIRITVDSLDYSALYKDTTQEQPDGGDAQGGEQGLLAPPHIQQRRSSPQPFG